MSQVLTPQPCFQYLDQSGTRWLLTTEYRCISDVLGVIVIPAGFISDGNSVPQLLQNIFPREQYLAAALPHDFLYHEGKIGGVIVARGDADKVHREFLVWAAAPSWKINSMYAGLRVGGWVAWNRYRRRQARATEGV